MLCWVHEGRAYKKLLPIMGHHRDLLKDFLQHFWEYYDRLLGYREQPSQEAALHLETEFDEIFATQTGYGELDKRIRKTQIKKASLLLVLKHPELPLHNNPAELAARFRVRKRDISFGPRTEDGRHAWDTFMTRAAGTFLLFFESGKVRQGWSGAGLCGTGADFVLIVLLRFFATTTSDCFVCL